MNLGENIRHIHFIGIGGISMSGLAEILHKDGYTITGSDWIASDITQHLMNQGIGVSLGNDAAHITKEMDLVVHTAAVKPNNPELTAARNMQIPTLDRAQLLGKMMHGYPYSVAIAGSHGKTTTTAIVSEVCLAAELDPTISIGGYMEAIGSNFRVGKSQYLVIEACEYFDSFLQFYPHVGVILNIDSDHLDYFGTLERLINSFRRFAQNIPPEGTLVIHGGIPCLKEIIDGLSCRVFIYGTEDADFWAEDIRYNEEGQPSFTIASKNSIEKKNVSLILRGAHNIDNALATAAVADVLGIPAKPLINGLNSAIGAKRRFEHKGMFNGVTVVDDYAHHPTEIRASLSAAKNGPHKRIVCAFQSHTYSRTQNLLDEFVASFEQADLILILPVFASREAISTELSPNYLSQLLVERLREQGKEAYFSENFENATSWLIAHTRPQDLLITMGAGDIHLLAERLVGDK